MTDWLEITPGDAPLVVAFPHTGTDIPSDMESGFISPWLAKRDADWWIHELYAFAKELGATTVRTRLSRSVIDVNRDPSGASLYPGQTTTELCPTSTFDGQALYATDTPPPGEIDRRRRLYFDPYHNALKDELKRLKAAHGRVVLYDAHSIRSHIPRLFEGELPQFNIGTNGGETCSLTLSDAVLAICAQSGHSHVLNGRFKGGWTTRHYGQPQGGVHAIQMELSMRGYLQEPSAPTEENWPAPWSPETAAGLTPHLHAILNACLAFARA